jgi:outer membrane protein assembly factor BamD
MMEVYLDLGLPDEAVHAASVLGYNYPGSTWYETAYGKLQDHGLVNAANTGQDATPMPAHQHHWYWPF